MNKIDTNLPKITEIVEFVLDYLGIDGITLTIAQNTRLLDRLAPPDIELEALTTATGVKDCYNIFFRDINPSKVVVCHEMIHLSQMVSGRLKMDLLSGRVNWEGSEYGNSTRYFDRPWEKEAFARQNEIVKAFRKK